MTFTISFAGSQAPNHEHHIEMQSDPTLRHVEGFKMGGAKRFPTPNTTDHSSAPSMSLLHSTNGRICGTKGTYPPGKHRVVQKQRGPCDVAFYTYPRLLEDGAARHSRGVTRTAPRATGTPADATNAPGPIFFPDMKRNIPGGAWSHARRFSGGEDKPAAHGDETASLALSDDIGDFASFDLPSRGVSRSMSATPGRARGGTAASRGRIPASTQSCTFGSRTTVPMDMGACDVHSYDVPTRVGRPPPPPAPSPLPKSRPQRAPDITPGPGHFFKNQFNVSSPVWSFGRRTRQEVSSTPGPAAYDVVKADAMNRRRRY
jgi:hypothetical protein